MGSFRVLQANLECFLEAVVEAVAQCQGHTGLLGDDHQAFSLLSAVGNGPACGFESAFALGSIQLTPADEADLRQAAIDVDAPGAEFMRTS